MVSPQGIAPNAHGGASLVDAKTTADLDQWFRRLSTIPIEDSERFLITQLVVRDGLYFVVGGPKVGKSTVLADLAVAIASATPAFGQFPVLASGQGPVLYVAVEDRPGFIRDRANLIGTARGVSAQALDMIRVCSDRRFRLDDPWEMDRLEGAVRAFAPAALMFDSLGRLHSGDERSALTIHNVLGRLLVLQQTYQLTVLVVHHVMKNAAASGATVRGSSALWAVADGCLALNRGPGADEVILTAEHRYAAASPAVILGRVGDPAFFFVKRTEDLAGVVGTPPSRPSLRKAIESCLRAAGSTGMTKKAIAAAVHRRQEDVGHTLTQLEGAGAVVCRGRGQWILSVPVPGLDDCGNGNGTMCEVHDA
jgi:hypothetical protein